MDVVLMVLIAIGAFCLGAITTFAYLPNGKYDGTLEVSEKDASQIHTLEIDTDPVDLKKQKSVRFRVKKVSDL